MFRGNAKSDLSKKYNGFGIRLIQLSNRHFHIMRAIYFQWSVYPNNATGRKLY